MIIKEKYQISFSGGKTSAFMTKMLIDNFSDQYDFIVTFANTGLEHEKTLEFVNNCDKYFGFNTVWLEAVVDPRKMKGTTHKVVSFETACRDNSLFESMIEKYGIPNKAYPHCTRELKLQVMESYLRSIDIQPSKIKTALGIRMDEKRRVSKTHEKKNITYPLIDIFPSDKEDVNIFWENQSFDLGIPEYLGNCRVCFKKSFKKLFLQLDDNYESIKFHERMEKIHAQTNNKEGYPDRVFFRQNTSTLQLVDMWQQDRISDDPLINIEDGGCSESCEIYATE